MNRKKVYITFIAVIVILVLGISIRDKYVDYTLNHPKPAYYIEYEVQPFDGIDKIADMYRPPYMSVEVLRSKIQVLNNVTSMIYPGTHLRVPIYK